MTGNTLHDALPIGSSGTEEASYPNRPFPLSVSVSALSFWSAILLPAVYLPLLLVGLSSVTDLVAFLGLFVLHVVALVGGRSYRRD